MTGPGALTRTVAVVLALLAAAAVLRGLAWAAALPAWQGPDEPAHYSYVERLAGGGFPPLQGERLEDSRALEASLEATGWERFRFAEPDRPLAPDRDTLSRESAGLSTDGHGASGATPYPPTYYLLALPLYALPGLDTATARLFAVRTFSALCAGLLVVMTALLVLEATRRPGLALAGGLLVSLPPLVAQASAIANPDILLAAAVAGLGWAAFRLGRLPGSTRERLHVAAWFLLVTTTKPVGIVLAVATLVGCLLAARPQLLTRRLAAAATAAAAAGGFALSLHAVAADQTRSSLVATGRYFWDFYRPRLLDGTAASTSRAWAVWVETGVGGFGWLTIWLPPAAYALGAAAVALALAATVAGIVREPRLLRLVGPLAGAVAVYVLGLHLVDLEQVLEGRDALLQGRYLIPAAPLAVAAFAAGSTALPRRVAAGVVGAVSLAWGLLALLGLDAVVRYFGS